jgi:hypothetical protein
MLRERLPENVKTIIFQGVGLATLVLGVQMALEVENFLTLIFSLVLGGILGEIVHLDVRMASFSEWLKAKIRVRDACFTEGLVTAFLIFCVGSMTFVGALNEGLTGDRDLILTKAVLDGFASIVFASVYGIGVLFSVIPLFLVQASLTLLAAQFQTWFSPLLITQLTATGGALILGIGFNLLEIKKVKTMNLLPALVVIAMLTWLLG